MSDLTEIKTMLKEQGEKFDEQAGKLNDIHFAIFGNERAGVKGIAKTVIEHGKSISEYKKLKYLGLGMATVSGAGIWQFIKSTFHL